MKRLLEYWTSNKNSKFSNAYKMELNRRLESIRQYIPCEFQPKPRDVSSLGKWKATEFMLLLLYIGPIVLKGLLTKEQYNNFLLFHMACRLLCTENSANTYTETAKEYLKAFYISAQQIYGVEFSVINVHNLVHLKTNK